MLSQPGVQIWLTTLIEREYCDSFQYSLNISCTFIRYVFYILFITHFICTLCKFQSPRLATPGGIERISIPSNRYSIRIYEYTISKSNKDKAIYAYLWICMQVLHNFRVLFCGCPSLSLFFFPSFPLWSTGFSFEFPLQTALSISIALFPYLKYPVTGACQNALVPVKRFRLNQSNKSWKNETCQHGSLFAFASRLRLMKEPPRNEKHERRQSKTNIVSQTRQN